jgi:hypothetical protein
MWLHLQLKQHHYLLRNCDCNLSLTLVERFNGKHVMCSCWIYDFQIWDTPFLVEGMGERLKKLMNL